MAKEYVLFNVLTGTILETLPIVKKSDSFGRDINSEDESTVTIPLYELERETRLYWHDHFLEWARGIALVDYSLNKVYSANVITNLNFNVNKETLKVSLKTVKELARKIRVKGWGERLNDEAVKEFTGDSWEKVYQAILQDCFISNSAEGANNTPDLFINWGVTGGTGRTVSSRLFDSESYADVMDRVRDEISGTGATDFKASGIEWKLVPQFRDGAQIKIAFQLVTGSETIPQINRDQIVEIPLVKNSGVKTIEYSVSTNATMAYNKLWVINQIEEGATMTPHWQDDEPKLPLLEETFDAGVELSDAQLDEQLSARLKQSEQPDFTVTFSKAEDFDFNSIDDLGKIYKFIGGTKSAGSGVVARVVGITSDATSGVVRYELMRLQQRYPILPKQKRKETLGSTSPAGSNNGAGGGGANGSGAGGFGGPGNNFGGAGTGIPLQPFPGGGDFDGMPPFGDWAGFGDNRIVNVNQFFEGNPNVNPEFNIQSYGENNTAELNFAVEGISPPYVRFNDGQIEAATVAYKDWIYYLPWNNFGSDTWEQYNGTDFDLFTDNWTIVKAKISGETGFITEREIAGYVGYAGINQLMNRKTAGVKPKHELFTNGISGDTKIFVDESAQPGYVIKRDFVANGGDPNFWYLNAFIGNVQVEMIPWVSNHNLYINQVVTQQYLQFTSRGYATTTRSETNSTLVRYPIDELTGELGLPITCNIFGDRSAGRTIKPSTQSLAPLAGTNKVVVGSWENIWDYTLCYGMWGTDHNGPRKNVDASSPAGLWTDQDFSIVMDFSDPDGSYTTFPNYQYAVPFVQQYPEVSSYGYKDWVVTNSGVWVDLVDNPTEEKTTLRTPALFRMYGGLNGMLYVAVNGALGTESWARKWAGVWQRPVNDTTWKRLSYSGPDGNLQTNPFMEIDGAIMYAGYFDEEKQLIDTLNTKMSGFGKRTSKNAKDSNTDDLMLQRINGGITAMHHNVTIWSSSSAHRFRSGSMKPMEKGESAVSMEGLPTLPDYSGLQASSIPTGVSLSGPM